MWETVKLGNICELNLGKTPARNNKKYWDKEKITSNVWLSIADLNSSIENYIGDSKEYISDVGASLSKPVAKGTLLMSFKLTIGRLAFTSRDLWTNEAIVALPIKDENLIIKEFLYHALSSINWHKLTKDDVKIKGKTLNKKKLAVIEIPLPSLAEQKRIVAKLDKDFSEIDSAIATTEYKQKEVEKLKLSLLKNELSSDNRQEKTEAWSVVKLGDACQILDNLRKPITKRDRKHGDYPYYGASGIVDYVANYIFDEVLVLIGEDGAKWDAGEKTAFIAKGKYWVNNHVHVIKLQADKLLNEWVTYYLNSIDLKPWITGLTVPKLNQKQLKSIPIPLPSLAEQKRIVARLDKIFKQADMIIDNTQKQLNEYQSLKTTLLTRELQSEAA